jgi:AcrR family transcriptional regulator
VQRKEPEGVDRLAETCLAAFIAAGTLDLSLDGLARAVGVSKRMLIHYFGSRENLELKALELLEDRLRGNFRAEAFPPGTRLGAVIAALWKQSVARESRGTLQVIMDISRRGWTGSERARVFYREQQRLWTELLLHFLPDEAAVEELLQLFQGAILAYLVTGDADSGLRALMRATAQYEAPSAGRGIGHDQ